LRDDEEQGQKCDDTRRLTDQTFAPNLNTETLDLQIQQVSANFGLCGSCQDLDAGLKLLVAGFQGRFDVLAAVY